MQHHTQQPPDPAELAKPRPFRAQARNGELLAMDPQAFGLDFMFGGPTPNDRTEDNIAIVTVRGPLQHHASYWWDSYEAVAQRVEEAMAGTDIVNYHEQRYRWRTELDGGTYEPLPEMPARAVVLCVDSPGGEAAGCIWVHKALRALRKRYDCPLYGYANECAASAAYAIISAADEIWVPGTGSVGSIGVIATMMDRMAMNEKMGLRVELVTSGDEKADGHVDRPLTDAILGRMQARVDMMADQFFRIVAKARHTSPRAVASLQAGMFTGREAVQVGVADGVIGWNGFLKLVGSATQTQTLLPLAAA